MSGVPLVCLACAAGSTSTPVCSGPASPPLRSCTSSARSTCDSGAARTDQVAGIDNGDYRSSDKGALGAKDGADGLASASQPWLGAWSAYIGKPEWRVSKPAASDGGNNVVAKPGRERLARAGRRSSGQRQRGVLRGTRVRNRSVVGGVVGEHHRQLDGTRVVAARGVKQAA